MSATRSHAVARAATLLAAAILVVGCVPGSRKPAPLDDPYQTGAAPGEEVAAPPTPSQVVRWAQTLEARDPGRAYLVEHPVEDRYLVTDRASLARLTLAGTPEARQALVLAADKDVSATARAAAATGLAFHSVGPAENRKEEKLALKVALDSVAERQPAARIEALNALSYLEDRKADKAIREALATEVDPLVLRAACEAAGRRRDPESQEMLWRIASGRPAAREATQFQLGVPMDVRQAALQALSRTTLDDPVLAVAPFTHANQPPALRVTAAETLGRLDDPAAVRVLIDQLDRRTPTPLIEAIHEALKLLTRGNGPPSSGLGGQGTELAAVSWSTWWGLNQNGSRDEWRRETLLAELPAEVNPDDDQQAIPVLLEWLGSPLLWQRLVAHEELTYRTGMTVPPRALLEIRDGSRAAATRDWGMLLSAPRLEAPPLEPLPGAGEEEPAGEGEPGEELAPDEESPPGEPGPDEEPGPEPETPPDEPGGAEPEPPPDDA